jgi:serine/threonine protein kinase
VPASAPRIVADRYRLVKKLGQGGMGRVWAAWDGLLGREVALKELLLPQGMTDEEAEALRERTLREARAIARLAHPNIVRFFDVVLDGGLPWIVMELVPSKSLHELVLQEGTLPPERVARIGIELVAALRAAHAEGVLHRDVKPANVLIATNGRVVLTDFGLVSLAGESGMTTTGIVMGSPSYMAPEQALDEPIGPPSDLWSLGATLYLAVEGKPPYLRKSPVSTLTALATEPPRPPRQAGSMRAALEALLEKDPARRADADTAERLLRVAAGETVPAAPARSVPRVARPRRLGRVLWPVGALAVAGLLVAVALLHPFDLPAHAQAHGPQPSASVAALAPSSAPTSSATPTPPITPAKAPVTTPAGATPSRSASGKPRASSSAGGAAVTKAPDLSAFYTVYYLAHANNLYVSADNGGASPLIAFPDSPGPWETFDEVDLGDGHIALRAEFNNKFVTAASTGTLTARSDQVGTAETFSLVFNSDGSVSLKSKSNGKYVTVPAGSAKPMLADQSSIGDTEKFDRTVIGQSG